MNEIILMMNNISNLSQRERFDLMHFEKVLNYLIYKLKNLSIEILGSYKSNIIELMNIGSLEGWCWQTTESAIVFFEDDDLIERGNLKLGSHKNYWHSWICFNFENKKFIFDPCLKVLTESYIYYYVFETSIEASVTAKQVNDDLLYRITDSKTKSYNEKTNDLFGEFFEQYLSEMKRTETYISGDNNVNSPM